MSSDQQDEPGPGPLSGLGRFTSGFGWNQATNFVKALATDVGMYCSRLNQMSIIDPTLSEIFVDTLSNENSELIDDVKTTSLNVAANIRQTIADVHKGNIWDAITRHEPGFQEQAKSTVSKGLEAGAGLEQHILLLQNDISTYIDDPVSSECNPDVEERFRCFRKSFQLDEQVNSDIMNSSPLVMAFYNELVPGKASEELFWMRYNFRLAEAKGEAARRERLLENITEAIDDRLHDLNLTWAEDDQDHDENEPVPQAESLPATESPTLSETAAEEPLQTMTSSEVTTDQGDWDDWS